MNPITAVISPTWLCSGCGAGEALATTHHPGYQAAVWVGLSRVRHQAMAEGETSVVRGRSVAMGDLSYASPWL